MKESTLKLQAPWEEVKEKLKEINTELTDSELAFEPGREDELLERLAAKMGKEPEDVQALIESLSFNKGKAS